MRGNHHAHFLIAACSAALASVAVAPCAFAMTASAGADNLVVVQVTPCGEFLPRDGRKLTVKCWRIDAAYAAQVIARFNALKTPLVVDYEHQTLMAEDNGKPAPAAGFFRSLEWREGQGLFATVELTANARRFLDDGEYRYFSPVFEYDDKTGAVKALVMGALTNNPALDGMDRLALRAAARFAINPGSQENLTMNKHLLAICVALGLTAFNDKTPEADAEAGALAEINKLKSPTDPLVKLRADLGVGADVGVDDISTAIAALKARTTDVDPSKHVPISVVTDLQAQLAALTARINGGDVDALIEQGIADGRLIKSMEPWARELGKKDVAQLRSFLDAAKPIAALNGIQTDGKSPVERSGGDGLTDSERAICRATGVSVEDFKKQKSSAATA